jgi:uncharacterized protein with PQ loop repeat
MKDTIIRYVGLACWLFMGIVLIISGVQMFLGLPIFASWATLILGGLALIFLGIDIFRRM